MPAVPRVVRTAAKALAMTLCVTASLLTFPAAIPGMLAAWLGAHTVARTWGRTGIVPALAGPLIAGLKGTFPTPGLITYAVIVVFTAMAVPIARRKQQDGRRFRTASLAALWLGFALLIWDWYAGIHASRRVERLPQSTIVCLGDSLTAPEGADGGYPETLAKLLPQRVVNLGQDGITSADALAKLPRLREVAPQIVVIELGGHDFLKGRSRAAAKASLERLIAVSREAGAEVILVEVPRGFVFDPWFGLERQLARELDLELVPDSVIRRFVLFSPYAPPGIWLPRDRLLSEDGLHPNQQGQRAFAAVVADAIHRIAK